MDNFYSMNAVSLRNSKRKQGVKSYSESFYPLRESSLKKDTYDFENLREAMYKWNLYAPSVADNWSKLMSIYETVDQYGTKEQLDECSSIIETSIIPYLQSPIVVKKDILNRIHESTSNHMRSCIQHMVDVVNENIECDRLLDNLSIISKRFDINKMVRNNILYEDAITETIYSLCEMVDSYSMDYRTKFCIAAESALYSIHNVIGNDPIEESYLKDKLNTQSILENVFDYFIINYGKSHTDQFLDEMSNTCHKDPFIRDQLDGYINDIKRSYAQSLVETVSPIPLKEIQLTYPDETLYGMTRDLDQYKAIREATEVMVREATFDDIKNKMSEMVHRIKIAPSVTVGMIKQALATLFVPCRAEDLGKGTHNALSFTFYALITLGAVISAGAFGMIFGALFSYTMGKHAQKVYLKDAIQEWRDHKYGVERKIKDCSDAEKKRRMEAYLVQVNNTLEKLETKYEETRDRTLSEIDKKAEQKKVEDNKTSNNFFHTPDINPTGLETPTSNFYDPSKSHHVKMAVAQSAHKEED